MTKYDDFIKVLLHNNKSYTDDIYDWNKYLYAFANFVFENMCLGEVAPIFEILIPIADKKLRMFSINKKWKGANIEKTKI